MPKPTKGPRLGGSSSHQKAILANLATSLFEHGRIKTTEPKARALRPYAEKLITHAKKGTLHNRREVMKKIRDKDVVHTLFAEIGPFFSDRNGGYTRIIKVEARKGDNAPMAVIELVREKTVTSEANRARRAAASKKAAPAKAAPASDEALAEETTASDEAVVEEAPGRGDRPTRPWPRRPPRRPSTRSRPRTRRSRRLEAAEAEAEAEAPLKRPRPRKRTPTRMPTSPREHERRTRHRFRWRVCSSSARYRLRRNGVRRLGGAGRAAHRGRRSRRRVVDGVPRAGAAACGGTHRRRCACHGSGGPRRRSDRCAGARVPAYDAGRRQRVPAAGAPARAVLARTMCASSTSTVPQRVSTPGSRRCAGTTSTGCRPPRTASSRRRRAS